MAGFWGGIGNLFKGILGQGSKDNSSQAFSGMTSFGPGFNVGGYKAGNTPMSYGGNRNSSFMGSLGSGINKLFTGGGNVENTARGLGLMGIGSMIPNPGIPKMPGAFDEYMKTAGQGGPPLTQSANQYMQSILNGTNTAATDAATRSLDLNYDEEKRNLISMYKSFRPGTDPTTDSTFQRDLNLINQKYAQNRADTLSRQQQGAAQYGMQQGNQQMGWQAQGVDALVNQIATQWQMNYNQRQALREQLMGLGTNMIDPSTALLRKLMGSKMAGMGV